MLIANYGSNLSKDQFARRCPSAKLVGTGTIPGYRLTFTGYSGGWKGSVATIKPADGARVLVAVYRLRSPADVRSLDRAEGFPTVYGCEEVTVHLDNGKQVKAWTYVKRDQREGQPSNDYLRRVAQGYKDHGLDSGALAEALCRLPAGTPMPQQKAKPAKPAPPKSAPRKPYGTVMAPYGRHPNGDPLSYPGEPAPGKRKGKGKRRKGKGKRKGGKGRPPSPPADDLVMRGVIEALEAETCGGKGCTPDLAGGAECHWCGDATCENHCPECCPTALAQFGSSLGRLF